MPDLGIYLSKEERCSVCNNLTCVATAGQRRRIFVCRRGQARGQYKAGELVTGERKADRILDEVETRSDNACSSRKEMSHERRKARRCSQMRFDTQRCQSSGGRKGARLATRIQSSRVSLQSGNNKLLARETDHKPDRGVEYATGAVVEGAAGWSRLGPVRSAALREEGGLIQG
ncbi:hypothetical protein J3E69DRAFT_59678 [Trichoderma sp. SZMC 28015]